MKRARRSLGLVFAAIGLASLSAIAAPPPIPEPIRPLIAERRRPPRQPPRVDPPPVDSSPINAQCDNRVGSVEAACAVPVSKPCENRAFWVNSCTSLVAIGFQPRASERIAQCVAKEKLVLPSCEPKTLKKCVRDALAASCPDDDATDRCTALSQNCRIAGLKPDFTPADCVQMISSLTPGPARDQAILQMSPTTSGCTRMVAVPFQPFEKPAK